MDTVNFFLRVHRSVSVCGEDRVSVRVSAWAGWGIARGGGVTGISGAVGAYTAGTSTTTTFATGLAAGGGGWGAGAESEGLASGPGGDSEGLASGPGGGLADRGFEAEPFTSILMV